MAIKVKPLREPATPSDGARVLVDRRWPRGISKEVAKLTAWYSALAPSVELCDWFGERPSQWTAFRTRYLEELERPEAQQQLEELHLVTERRAATTLLTSVRDTEHSAAAVLRDLLDGMRKPPRTTGPAKASAAPQRARARR